jgi:hypothetical protein
MGDVRTTAIDKNGNVCIGSVNTAIHKAFKPATLPTAAVTSYARLYGTTVKSPFWCLGLGGYGGVINSNGTLYTAAYPGTGGFIMCYDTAQLDLDGCQPAIQTAAQDVYGLGIDRMDINNADDDVIVASAFFAEGVWSSSVPDNAVSYICPGARGITVDNHHHLWMACSGMDYVKKVEVNALAGTYTDITPLGVTVGNTPTGMAVDGNGK